MACWVGAHGQVNSTTKVKTYPRYDITQGKPHTQNKKQLFLFDREDLLNP